MATLSESDGSKPPVSMDVADRRRIHVESDDRIVPGSNEDEATWRIAIQEFGTHRVIARWSVRRVHVRTPLTEDWALAVGRSTGSNAESASPVGSEHALRVAHGDGDRWHVPPSERPIGSSEWLTRGSERPPPPSIERRGSASHGPQHLGGSERWRRPAHAQALEDKVAAERPAIEREESSVEDGP